MLNNAKPHRTKKGDEMCFVSGNDEFGSIDLTFMPKAFALYRDYLKKGNIVLVNATKDPNYQSLTVEKMTILKG